MLAVPIDPNANNGTSITYLQLDLVYKIAVQNENGNGKPEKQLFALFRVFVPSQMKDSNLNCFTLTFTNTVHVACLSETEINGSLIDVRRHHADQNVYLAAKLS